MVARCCVCNNSSKESTLHRFPYLDEEVYNVWVSRVGLEMLRTLHPTEVHKKFRLCHEHFSHHSRVSGPNNKLRCRSLPTLHLAGYEGLPDEQNSVLRWSKELARTVSSQKPDVESVDEPVKVGYQETGVAPEPALSRTREGCLVSSPSPTEERTVRDGQGEEQPPPVVPSRRRSYRNNDASWARDVYNPRVINRILSEMRLKQSGPISIHLMPYKRKGEDSLVSVKYKKTKTAKFKKVTTNQARKKRCMCNIVCPKHLRVSLAPTTVVGCPKQEGTGTVDQAEKVFEMSSIVKDGSQLEQLCGQMMLSIQKLNLFEADKENFVKLTIFIRENIPSDISVGANTTGSSRNTDRVLLAEDQSKTFSNEISAKYNETNVWNQSFNWLKTCSAEVAEVGQILDRSTSVDPTDETKVQTGSVKWTIVESGLRIGLGQSQPQDMKDEEMSTEKKKKDSYITEQESNRINNDGVQLLNVSLFSDKVTENINVDNRKHVLNADAIVKEKGLEIELWSNDGIHRREILRVESTCDGMDRSEKEKVRGIPGQESVPGLEGGVEREAESIGNGWISGEKGQSVWNNEPWTSGNHISNVMSTKNQDMRNENIKNAVGDGSQQNLGMEWVSNSAGGSFDNVEIESEGEPWGSNDLGCVGPWRMFVDKEKNEDVVNRTQKNSGRNKESEGPKVAWNCGQTSAKNTQTERGVKTKVRTEDNTKTAIYQQNYWASNDVQTFVPKDNDFLWNSDSWKRNCADPIQSENEKSAVLELLAEKNKRMYNMENKCLLESEGISEDVLSDIVDKLEVDSRSYNSNNERNLDKLNLCKTGPYSQVGCSDQDSMEVLLGNEGLCEDMLGEIVDELRGDGEYFIPKRQEPEHANQQRLVHSSISDIRGLTPESYSHLVEEVCCETENQCENQFWIMDYSH